MAGFEYGDEWDDVVDVVVVGSGAAAGAAAATAASLGASVTILEKAEWVGGTTGKSGGVFWVPNNPMMQEMGLADDRDGAIRYMARSAFPAVYRMGHPTLGLPENSFRLLEAFYDRGAEAIGHLRDTGALRYRHVPYPDYYADLPEGRDGVGRVCEPDFPEGHRRGIDPTGGQLLADMLVDGAVAQGATLRLGTEVRHLVRDDDGRVVGVEARSGTRTLIIGARRGVVFGSGGFIHNREYRLAYLRGPVLGGAAAESATGDFVRIGIEAGAKLGNMSHAWWDQVAVEHAVTVPSTIKDVYNPHGDSMLQVNKHGVRVVNEKAVYNDRGTIHSVWDPSRYEYPNLLLFMIWDQAVVDNTEFSRFRWPVPLPGEEPLPFVARADTLAGLAAEFRRRLDGLADFTGGVQLADDFEANLQATVARFNDHAARGIDPDFRRGESQIEKNWGGTPRPGLPSPCLAPLAPTGPYYGLIVGPGALDTKGGPVINADGQVMSVHDEPIPGLYGAGNCIAAPSGQAYWGPGGTIGPAMVFGYIAARHAVGA